jgi:hypothetical protein
MSDLAIVGELVEVECRAFQGSAVVVSVSGGFVVVCAEFDSQNYCVRLTDIKELDCDKVFGSPLDL